MAKDDSDASVEATLTQVQGSLDLGDKARAPNALIRKIVDAMYLQCVWPGCSKPGILTQYHHVVAAKDGDPTSVWNLTKLCSYHNGRNDDDRSKPVNGYVFVDEDGAVKYQPPDGSAPIIATDPLSKLGALELSRANPEQVLSLEEVLDVPVPTSCHQNLQSTENQAEPSQDNAG